MEDHQEGILMNHTFAVRPVGCDYSCRSARAATMPAIPRSRSLERITRAFQIRSDYPKIGPPYVFSCGLLVCIARLGSFVAPAVLVPRRPRSATLDALRPTIP